VTDDRAQTKDGEDPEDNRRALRVWPAVTLVSAGVIVRAVVRRRARLRPRRVTQPEADVGTALLETMALVGDRSASFQEAIADEAQLDSARPQSGRLRRYRVWEANREIFLYPENWLEPELRDGRRCTTEVVLSKIAGPVVLIRSSSRCRPRVHRPLPGSGTRVEADHHAGS